MTDIELPKGIKVSNRGYNEVCMEIAHLRYEMKYAYFLKPDKRQKLKKRLSRFLQMKQYIAERL